MSSLKMNDAVLPILSTSPLWYLIMYTGNFSLRILVSELILSHNFPSSGFLSWSFVNTVTWFCTMTLWLLNNVWRIVTWHYNHHLKRRVSNDFHVTGELKRRNLNIYWSTAIGSNNHDNTFHLKKIQHLLPHFWSAQQS